MCTHIPDIVMLLLTPIATAPPYAELPAGDIVHELLVNVLLLTVGDISPALHIAPYHVQ
jgi:hypothetical protein